MKTKERGGQQQRPLVVDQSPHKIEEEEDIGTVWGGLIFLSSASQHQHLHVVTNLK